MHGVSTRAVDDLVKAMGASGVSIEGEWPYLWIDATYVKAREAGRIVSVRRPVWATFGAPTPPPAWGFQPVRRWFGR